MYAKLIILYVMMLSLSCYRVGVQNEQLAQKIQGYPDVDNGVHSGVLKAFQKCAKEAEYNLEIIDRAAKMAFTIDHSTQSLLFIALTAKTANRDIPELNLAIDSIVMLVFDSHVKKIIVNYMKEKISCEAYRDMLEEMITKSEYETLEEAIKANLI